MRKKYIMALGFLLSLFLTSCNTEKDLQRLSMIEVYQSDGELVNVIKDTDILYQFNNLDYTDISADTDSSQNELEIVTEDLSVLCTIISYKSSAALHSGKTLEKLMETTIYENSNIIKEQVEPDNIKGRSIPEEYLTFYITISKEDKDFLLSLAEFNK